MATPDHLATASEAVTDTLPDQLGELTRQISEWGVFDLFTSSIARREWTSHLIERSLSSTHGWIEFLCALALMFIGYWLLDRKFNQHDPNVERPADDVRKISFVRHLKRRLIWPVLLFIAALIITKMLEHFNYHPLWFGLIMVAAAWMMMVRIIAASLHYALPSNIFNERYETILSTSVWAIFLLWITGATDIVIDWAKGVSLSIGGNNLTLFAILSGIIWVVLILILAMWLAKAIETRLMGFQRLDMSLRIALSNITKTLLVVLSFLIALPLVGINLTVLSVFGGALGVGLGFGLQKVASNYVSGFIILFDRSVRVGDRINVNNFNGYVTKITTRYTVVKNTDGAEALVPNENFIANMVINESYSGKSLWRSLVLQVSYDSDVNEALNIMKQVAESQERVLGAASATVVNFGDNGINLNLGFWVKDPENGFGLLASNILLDIWQRFNEQGINFPYPQREVRILNNDAINKANIPKVHIPTSKEGSISNEPSKAHHENQPNQNLENEPMNK